MWKNRILYLIISVLLAYYCIVYNRRDTALIFFMILAFPWTSAFMMLLYHRRIRIEYIAEQPVVMKQEECTVYVRVYNDSIWPISKIEIPFTYGISMAQQTSLKLLVLAIAGKGKQELELKFHSDYVGNIHFYMEKYYIWDFCKCTRVRKKYSVNTEVMVMPKEQFLEEMLQTGGWNLSENESILLPKPGSEQTEILYIREYAQGDRINKIHWKLSSKYDELMVKEYATVLYYLPLAVLDLRRVQKESALDYLDTIYDAFVSIAVWHIKQKTPLRAVYYDIHQQDIVGTTIWNREDLIMFLHSSYENIYYDDKSRSIEGVYSKNEMYRHSNILYFTSEFQEDTSVLDHMEVFCCYITKDEVEEEKWTEIYKSFGSGGFHIVRMNQREKDIEGMAVTYLSQNRGEFHES